jgi:4-hydroxy-tetrahydrodipicolinate synthase
MTMEASWLRGCATALVTPFTSEGNIDQPRLLDLINYQIANGVRLLVACGTTGESATMSEDEDEFVFTTTVDAAKGQAKVIAGTGSNSTAAAIAYSKRAQAAGVNAILVVAPYYNKPTQEGLYLHFRAVAESVGNLPVIIYNVPGRTSSNISAETTLRLAHEVDNIVGVKEASGNLAQIMEIIRSRPRNFNVISGDDSLTLAIMALGGDGLISVAANEAPTQMSRMVDLALAGNWDDARALHYQLLPLMEVNFIESSPGPVKAALAMMGMVKEHVRLPLVPIQEKSRARVCEVLLELGLLKDATHASA